MKPAKTPCPSCPFSRAVTPGALGGSSPWAFIGQAYGPFTLPCHKHCDFDDPEWGAKAAETPQCAGAAIFRGHVGAQLPAAIPILPANPLVFSDAAEFIAHHTRSDPGAWKRRLANGKLIGMMVAEQLGKAARGEKP